MEADRRTQPTRVQVCMAVRGDLQKDTFPIFFLWVKVSERSLNFILDNRFLRGEAVPVLNFHTLETLIRK